MTFEAMYKQAIEVLTKLAEENKVRSPDETICLICSRSGKTYSGVSRKDNSGGAPQHIPAERVALGSMVMSGETVIDTLVIINSMSRMAILPSKDSVNYFFSVNAENVNGKAVMPNKEVPFSEIGDPSFASPNAGAAAAPAPEKKAAPKNILLDRVNSLMEGIEDDEDDEDLVEELDKSKKKKKRFGFF